MEYGWIKRLRGIDQWPFVEAIVISVRQIKKGNRYGDGAWRMIRFRYRCGSQDFKGSLFVDNYSSVYELAAGDNFDVQCNPRRPRQYFCEEAKSIFAEPMVILPLMILLLLLFGLANVVFGR